MTCTDGSMCWHFCAIDALPPDLRADARQVDGASAGLVGTPIGRLADWPAIAEGWSTADRAAFRAFIDERVRPAASDGIWRSVLERREALVRSQSLAGALANMWRTGVHPLQDDD